MADKKNDDLKINNIGVSPMPKGKEGAAWRPIFLAAAGGALQALSWAGPGFWYLAVFFCLAPLIWAVANQPGRLAFRLGMVYGLTLSLISLYWLADVLALYGGLGLAAGWFFIVVMGLILAVYQGLFALLIRNWQAHQNRCILFALLGAGYWCGLEWLKNLIFTGFNWTPLAGPLTYSETLIQAADIFGVYGLNFLVAFINFLLINLVFSYNRNKANPFIVKKINLKAAVCLIIVMSLWAVYGHTQYQRWQQISHSGQSKKIAVLQPSIPLHQKWDGNFMNEILSRYSALVDQAAKDKPWLILWPETAAPFVYLEHFEESVWLDDLAQKHASTNMLVGVAAFGFNNKNQKKYYNRAWLFQNGQPQSFYDKRHLVPFGEYVPLEDELPFLKWPMIQGLIGAAGMYTPGRTYESLVVDGNQLGILICFESIFPEISRQRVLEGADILVVTTNDGWFGLSWAARQHLQHARMRAVETRRPLIRASNNGISTAIAPSGKTAGETALNEIGTFIYDLPVLSAQDKNSTLFVSYGYWLGPLTAVLTALSLLIKLARRNRQKQPN